MGTGLGLSVVHGIAESFGASIVVDSTPGSGTIFHIFFPAGPDLRPRNVCRRLMKEPMREKRVDHRRRSGYPQDADARCWSGPAIMVRTAENGDEALPELSAAEADIVITDIIMPKMHGVDAIKTIVKEFSRVRIIAISGGGNFGITDYKPDAIITSAYLAAARKAGAHALLTKPFQTADVLHAITEATGDSSVH